MESSLRNPLAEVVLSCLSEKYLKNEVMLDDHCFVRIISGEVKIVQFDTSRIFGPGDTILFPRRQLSTVIQYPKNNEAYKCVLIMFKTERLKDYYSRNAAYETTERSPALRFYEKHPLIESYFSSLLPYFDLQDELPEKLLTLKIEEALTILRTIDDSVDSFFGRFFRTR